MLSIIIHGWIVLPEHLHCVIELPENDQDFSTRLHLIKSDFSKTLPKDERRSKVQVKRSERGIWQRRFWEYLIRVLSLLLLINLTGSDLSVCCIHGPKGKAHGSAA